MPHTGEKHRKGNFVGIDVSMNHGASQAKGKGSTNR
jgi:hypothetical protein